MLIEFRLKNYASFKNEAFLSAQTGERLYKYKDTNTFQGKDVSLLKNLLIFGPNGAGKSRLLRGLDLMKYLVLNGGAETITDQLIYNPFMFNKKNQREDTTFSVTLQYNDQIYEYSFSYNNERISSEKLVLINGNKEETYFERTEQDFSIIPNNLKDLIPRLRKNALFLYLAQQNNDAPASDIYKWFTEDLSIILPNNHGRIGKQFSELLKNKQIKDELLSFLQAADFNISDITVRNIPISIEGNPLDSKPQSVPMLFTSHKVYNDEGDLLGQAELPLTEESDGTIRTLYIALVILDAQMHGNNRTIVFDEFDSSLHPELARTFIKIFNSKENLNQFILTTQDVQLLDNPIRIDQIYLVDKNFQGVSDLKSVFDFSNPRTSGRLDVNLAKKYIEGKFGSMPIVDTDRLLDILHVR
ncbi:MAG: ATP/GTP-binding protein [Candidatus Limosilactobacillus intestinavium]